MFSSADSFYEHAHFGLTNQVTSNCCYKPFKFSQTYGTKCYRKFGFKKVGIAIISKETSSYPGRNNYHPPVQPVLATVSSTILAKCMYK